VNVPLPWERVLWSGRPRRPRAVAGERYVLTDFRLVRVGYSSTTEIVLHDIGEIRRSQSRIDRLLGTSTLVVHARDEDAAPIVLVGIGRGAALAALLELLSGDPRVSLDSRDANAALRWEPRASAADTPYSQVLGAVAVMLMAMFGVVIGLHGNTRPVTYASDDPIAPDGIKRDRAEIVRFMESEVMPWARQTLGRIKGGPDHVTCQTCHATDAARRDWRMPSVAALPQPDVKERGWETYGGGMDAQMRNAIYGYLAESEKQTKASYMREIVMPGMARLLHRPAYDFTQPYDYNRSRRALGCYHCHTVS
jgi:hypothetical protein